MNARIRPMQRKVGYVTGKENNPEETEPEREQNPLIVPA